MSGPKDFTVVYSTASAAEIRRRNEIFRQERIAHVQDKLARARADFEASLSNQRASTYAAIQQSLTKRAEERAEALRVAQTTARHHARSDPSINPPEPVPKSVPLQASEVDVAREREAEVRAEWSATLQGWSEVLEKDDAVTSFAPADLVRWRAFVDAWKTGPVADIVADATKLAAEAQRIHEQAGETQMKFDVRNRLLVDVIESMKEIGYFVSDPYFADPADPTSPAVIKATCGSDTVTASVDLGAAVRSVWDGQEHEHCKSTFFAYMDAMKTRGAEVVPDRADLRERPVLKQMGANELPRSNPGRRGVGE